MKKRLLSGIKPTGNIHIGNYFGAMRQFLDLQNQYDCYIFLADYHALNQVQNAEELRRQSDEIIKALLAIGLDPEKITLFRQSDVPEVTELCWIFNCITSMAALKLAHAYKDAVAKKLPVNMGLFDYPVLMAADILLYGANVVPVGQDQKQHVEIAADMARRFNHLFGETFKIPQVMIRQEVGVVTGLDGRKMSKSYNNTIGLFDNAESVRKKVMSIVTDSRGLHDPKDPEKCHIFALHKLFSMDLLEDLTTRYKKGDISYKESKEILAKNIVEFLQPIWTKKAELDKNPHYVREMLENGAKKARVEAQKTLKKVKQKIGL